MKKLIVLLILFFACFSFSPHIADAGLVFGRIIHADNTGVPNAIVKNGLGFFVRTDSAGYYSFGLLAGNINLTAHATCLNDYTWQETGLGLFESRYAGEKMVYPVTGVSIAEQKTKPYPWPSGWGYCAACAGAGAGQTGTPYGEQASTPSDPACQSGCGQ